MIINHNISALNSSRNLNLNNANVRNTMAKLSSGLRITKAADDASGLAVAEKMRAQIGGLNQARRNVQDAVSFIQTTEGYLQGTGDILRRLRVLSVQAANGIYQDEDRKQVQVEVNQLVDEVDRIANQGQFNGIYMLQGKKGEDGKASPMNVNIQVGPNVDEFESVSINVMNAGELGLVSGQEGSGPALDLGSQEGANKAIGILDNALNTVNKQRADLGAYQNRFEIASKGIAIAAENLQSAESKIRDADMAKVASELVRDQILSQASIAMLSQANVKNQGVLRLLS